MRNLAVALTAFVLFGAGSAHAQTLPITPCTEKCGLTDNRVSVTRFLWLGESGNYAFVLTGNGGGFEPWPCIPSGKTHPEYAVPATFPGRAEIAASLISAVTTRNSVGAAFKVSGRDADGRCVVDQAEVQWFND